MTEETERDLARAVGTSLEYAVTPTKVYSAEPLAVRGTV